MKLSDQEKFHLRNKISQSISNYIQRKRYIKYGLGLVAACVVLLFSITIFQEHTQQNSPLDSYVKSLKAQDIPDHVKLILNENQKMEIADADASISYSNSGEKVTIGDSKSVNQRTSKDQKVVFNTLIVPYGRRSSIELADGTKVWLNSGSKLVFPAAFTQEKREVYLEGEGIFEVAHDKKHPFVVKSGEQDIEVLGTVFNVSNYQDDEAIHTVLKTGSIKIIYQNGSLLHSNETVSLTPGMLATYNRSDRQIETQTVEVEKYFSWRDGIFIFKNDSLKSIMKKVSRYYNIQIVINNADLATTTFSGYLDVKDNVENIIKTIQETTNFDYTITNNKLIIN